MVIKGSGAIRREQFSVFNEGYETAYTVVQVDVLNLPKMVVYGVRDYLNGKVPAKYLQRPIEVRLEESENLSDTPGFLGGLGYLIGRFTDFQQAEAFIKSLKEDLSFTGSDDWIEFDIEGNKIFYGALSGKNIWYLRKEEED